MNKIYNFFCKHRDIVIIYSLALLYFVIDIVSKSFILRSGNLLFKKEVIKNFFYLDLQKNTGAAFSFMEGGTIFFVIVAIITLYFIHKYLLKEKLNVLKILSYSLLIGGICGNLYDRIFYGYVIDFLSFKFGTYYFPVFNFADTFISIGAFLLVIDIAVGGLYEFRSKRK